MRPVPLVELPHAQDLAAATGEGNLVKLVMANVAGASPTVEPLDPRASMPGVESGRFTHLPADDRYISEVLAVRIAEGWSDDQILEELHRVEPYKPAQYIPGLVIALKKALRIPSESGGGKASRRVLIRALYTGRPPLVLPDEQPPPPPENVPPSVIALLGMQSIGLSRTDIYAACRVAHNRLIRANRELVAGFDLSSVHPRVARGITLAVGRAFETGLITVENPEPLIKPELFVPLLRGLMAMSELAVHASEVAQMPWEEIAGTRAGDS